MTKAVYIIVILYIFLSGFHAYFQYWENSSITKAFFYLIVDLALPLVGFFFLNFHVTGNFGRALLYYLSYGE